MRAMHANNQATETQNRKNAHRVPARIITLIFQAAEVADFLNSDERTDNFFCAWREMHNFFHWCHPRERGGSEPHASCGITSLDTRFRGYDKNGDDDCEGILRFAQDDGNQEVTQHRGPGRVRRRRRGGANDAGR